MLGPIVSTEESVSSCPSRRNSSVNQPRLSAVSYVSDYPFS